MALIAHSNSAGPISQLLEMQNSGTPRILERADQLLWVMARCDVENVHGHRTTVLERLCELELRAAAVRIPDLYREVVQIEIRKSVSNL
jgi:hypothetical protein